MMEFQQLTLTTDVDFIAGDQDSYVAVDRLSHLPGTHLHLLPGVDHFFQGHNEALQRSIRDALS
jgi:alpha/beta superfamily hydrolase